MKVLLFSTILIGPLVIWFSLASGQQDAQNESIGADEPASVATVKVSLESDFTATRPSGGSSPKEFRSFRVGPLHLEMVNGQYSGNLSPYVLAIINDYNQVLGLNQYKEGVNRSNAGINGFALNELTRDPNFQALATKFYEKISEFRSQEIVDICQNIGRSSEGPCLSLETGVGATSNYKPGWVWDLAMKFSKNDSNLAMRLIGVCGHDDVARGEVEKILKCPDDKSPFFLPGSLGIGEDISPSLKLRIIETNSSAVAKKFGIQRERVPNFLPAKYYHVYGSAYVACEMIVRGHSPLIIEKLQPLLALGYRLQTLDESLRQNQERIKHMKKKKQWPNGNNRIWKGYNQNMDDGEEQKTTRDAAFLARQWTYRPLSNFRVGNLRFRLPDLFPNPLLDHLFRRKPNGWSEERFEKAKTQFRIWMTDFDWTKAEHSIGAAFAAKHCHPEGVKENAKIEKEGFSDNKASRAVH